MKSIQWSKATNGRTRLKLLGLGLLFVGIGLILVTPSPTHSATSPPAPSALRVGASPVASTAPELVEVPSAQKASSLQLSIADSPSSICVLQETSCPAGVGVSRVTLTAQAPQSQYTTWPAVQVAFVLETTLYDGVYDPTAFDFGSDQCADANMQTGPACEESNGIPFFVANAQQIANAIQSANPHSLVQFALVDYFASLDIQDDGDGAEYHVDIPRFVPASQFGADVQSSFGSQVLESGYRYSDSDFSDNFLHSSSITALYGTIIGSGLNWSANTHHVIVWIGTTAPRDPAYVQDYCVSPSSRYPVGGGGGGLPCDSSSCEPAYTFGSLTSPQCEGWVVSQNGNSSDSIAQLAQTVPQCTLSIGQVCTIDTIDLWGTPDDPSSPGWPAGDNTPALQGGPNGPMVDQNAARVLLAGCDLAAATGGTWDGPSFFACPNGQAGTLTPSFLGPFGSPHLQNSALFEALRGIGFGPVTSSLVATGTTHPIFTFVPFGNIVVLPGGAAQFQTACQLADGTLSHTCPLEPVETSIPTGPGTNTTVYGWNWSTIPSQNVMYAGDTWIASFWVEANGPPYGSVPLDACTTVYCKIGGSSAIGGFYTAATYLPVTNVSVFVESFPLATIGVEAPPANVFSPSLPPPAPTPPPPPIPTPAPLGLLTPVGLGAQVGVASLSLQAAGAGFIAAGFTTISIRNRPMTVAVAALAKKTGPVRSRFEEGTSKDGGVGRFE